MHSSVTELDTPDLTGQLENWIEQRTSEAGDDRGDDEDEEFETCGGIPGEQDAILGIANGPLDQAKLRRGQPAAE